MCSPTTLSVQKPPPGIFDFAKLSFLDRKVSRCYGCGQSLKPGGLMPCAPDDFVLTTRLQRRYYKDGRQHISPDITSVYIVMSTPTASQQPFRRFNQVFVKCRQTSYHSFCQSISKWLPTGLALPFKALLDFDAYVTSDRDKRKRGSG